MAADEADSLQNVLAVVSAARSKHGSVKLELGCGDAKHTASSIGIDMRRLPGVDIVGEVVSVLKKIPDGTIDAIDSYHFVEHVGDLGALMREAARVLVPGGVFECTVPHFSNPFYYSDPTHRQPFGLYTFAYLVRDSFTSRHVPQYEQPLPFSCVNAEYAFKSYRPHYLRHGLKQVGRVFNATTWTKEWYEERWCWALPAHEVHYALVRLSDENH